MSSSLAQASAAPRRPVDNSLAPPPLSRPIATATATPTATVSTVTAMATTTTTTITTTTTTMTTTRPQPPLSYRTPDTNPSLAIHTSHNTVPLNPPHPGTPIPPTSTHSRHRHPSPSATPPPVRPSSIQQQQQHHRHHPSSSTSSSHSSPSLSSSSPSSPLHAPLLPDGSPAPLYAGETFTDTFHGLRFRVRPSTHTRSTFTGCGSVYLSSTRLVLVSAPHPPSTDIPDHPSVESHSPPLAPPPTTQHPPLLYLSYPAVPSPVQTQSHQQREQSIHRPDPITVVSTRTVSPNDAVPPSSVQPRFDTIPHHPTRRIDRQNPGVTNTASPPDHEAPLPLEPGSDPAQTASSSVSALSIPLAWFRKDKLFLRRPFFDCRHLHGIFVPAPNALAPAFGPPGRPVDLRIEMIHDGDSKDVDLRDRMLELLADSELVAAESKRLRDASDSMLVPSDVHYAFVDPVDPTYLILGTHMVAPRTNL